MKQSFIMPAHGRVLDLDQVPDELFRQRQMGDGFAIELIGEEIIAPMDGIVSALFPTGHAIGLKLNDSIDLLIHIGINSVQLKNHPIEIFVQQNDQVKQGQLLARVDLAKFKAGNVEPIVPIIFLQRTFFQIKRGVDEVQLGEENIVRIFD